jgi:hypothetical protein
LGGWVAVSRFLKFPILENFAGWGKSRLRPSARNFLRQVVGGYTRRSEGENRKERAVIKTARSFLPPAAPSYTDGCGQGRTGPAHTCKPSAGGLLWPVVGAPSRGNLQRKPSSSSWSVVIAWLPTVCRGVNVNNTSHLSTVPAKAPASAGRHLRRSCRR